MRRAGRIVAETIERLVGEVRSGITTKDLDRFAEDAITAAGAIPSFKGYRGFPASICTSVNEELVHGIPNDRKLAEGDILSLDVGAIWDGFHGDSAVTVFVDGAPSGEAKRLVATTEESLQGALALIGPDVRLSDVGHAVQDVVETAGFHVVRDYVGHGIGRSLHEDPPVPNYGPPGRGPRIRPGWVLAIEPMVQAGTAETKVLGDNWTVVSADGSLTAHFEHTVAITEEGIEVLTRRASE